MTSVFTAACPFCGCESEAIQRDLGDGFAEGYPPDAFQAVPTGRMLRDGGIALLHHPCPDFEGDQEWPRSEPYWDPNSAWWACKHPERSLDEDAHYDLSCPMCAARLAAENPTSP